MPPPKCNCGKCKPCVRRKNARDWARREAAKKRAASPPVRRRVAHPFVPDVDVEVLVTGGRDSHSKERQEAFFAGRRAKWKERVDRILGRS